MFGLDKPYINIFMHRTCMQEVGEINLFLAQNVKMLYNYIRKLGEMPKKDRKWRNTAKR